MVWWTDLRLVMGFMTRLPLGHGPEFDQKTMARALRLGPLAGLPVAAAGALAYWFAHGAGLGGLIGGLIALVATIAITGAMHEDGLADFADGLGTTGPPQKRIAAMRDSRLGAFACIALILSIMLRAMALGSLVFPSSVFFALIAAHCLARGLLPLIMVLFDKASDTGLAATIERPRNRDAALALGLGLLAAFFGLGIGGGLIALVAAVLTAGCVVVLANRALGGITGDVLGAAQQLAEIAILLSAVSLL